MKNVFNVQCSRKHWKHLWIVNRQWQLCEISLSFIFLIKACGRNIEYERINRLHIYWHSVTYITTFGNFFRSYSELLSTFGALLFQEYVSKGFTHQVRYDDLAYKLRRVKGEANFISSVSKIVKCIRRRQNDPAIIERIVLCLALLQCTALYRSFIKRCILTNIAIGTIRRALFKPPQRRQVPDRCPLWLWSGTPSAFGPELVYRLRVAQPTLMDIPIYF